VTKRRSALEWLGLVMVVCVGLGLSAVGGVVIWSLGHPVWALVWLGLCAYIGIGGLIAARQPPTNPWVDYRGGWTMPPWKTREALRKQWDEEHRSGP
jgi:hypothetical protein